MNWMRSFFNVFHTSQRVCFRCYYLPKNYETRRDSRLFGRGGGGTRFPVDLEPRRWGILLGAIRWCRLSFVSFFFFFFRDIGRCTRFFRSRYVTWNTMATCRMSNTLFETIRILFFLPFLDASYEGYVFRLRMQIQMYVKSVKKIFVDWKEEKKKGLITQRSKIVNFSSDIRGIFLMECHFKRMKWTFKFFFFSIFLNIILEYISNIFNPYKNIKAFQVKKIYS